MRLFVAIDLPLNIKDYLFALQSSLKNSKLAKINWVAKKNLHLTLKFLGEVSDEKINSLKSSLSKIKYEKFNANLTNLGIYKSNLKINVVWIGVDPENKFIELQKLVDSETLNFGDIKLGAHLTLGRVKFVKNKKGLLTHIDNTKVESLNFKVGSFVLFRSTLAKDGPTYEVLERYSLV